MGVMFEEVKVPYEFQTNANSMLKINKRVVKKGIVYIIFLNE